MTELYCAVDGIVCTWIRLTVGYVGPWQAEVRLPSLDALGSPCTITLGTLRLRGTPAAVMDGTYIDQRRARIVGGAAGWSSSINARGYHNDAGVKARLIAEDAARDAGETLGTFIPTAERLGTDYARPQGLASSVLADAIGAAAWWVDYEGVTHVGPRPATAANPELYEILAYDPAERLATLSVEDPAAVMVGGTIAKGLAAAEAVRELEIVAGGDEPLSVRAWLGGTAQDPGRLASLLSAITRRASASDEHLYGIYRYRVVSQSGDGRCDLQSVQAAAGLPDLRAITIWAGTPGAHARLALGAEVLVQFVDGHRSQPLIMGHAPYGASGFTPQHLTLGGNTGLPAARKGDAVQVTLPLASFTGTIGGSSVTGEITAWTPTTASGEIIEGSATVDIAPGGP